MVPIRKRLPFQIALGALLLYVLTLSHGATLANLSLTAKLAGWDTTPMNGRPLLWLTTLPLRLLPAGWIAPVLNLYSAVLAALVLGVLARSLEAAKRNTSKRTSWRSRLPILMACAFCGLEFNFWSEATAGTGEMLQLLLLAASIWCLLEYRIHHEFRWMQAAVFIWGLGLAENWLMALTLPVFVVAVFWLGRLRILSRKILLRLALAGLAGFSIFIIVPLLHGLVSHSPYGPWEALRMAVSNYHREIRFVRYRFWNGQWPFLLLVVFFYLIMTLPLIVRQHQVARNRRLLDRVLYRGQMILWVLVAAWLAFDPTAGPRQIIAQQTGLALPFLSLDYLAGFCAGNLMNRLLLASRVHHRMRVEKLSQATATPAFTVLFIAAVAGLVFRNAPAILLANREPLREFGELALNSLPPGGGLLLSDEPLKLMAFREAAARQGNQGWVPVNVGRLTQWDYRAQLSGEYPGNWMTRREGGQLDQKGVATLVTQLTRTGRVYYLQDDSGFLFENLYLEPTGPVFALKPWPDDSLEPPPSSSATITTTEQAWDNAAPQLEEIERTLTPGDSAMSGTVHHVMRYARIQPVSTEQSQALANWYSVALNDWGVRLQGAGQLTAAHKRFAQALELNTNNFAAQVNLQCNAKLTKGVKMDLSDVKVLSGQLDSPERISQFLAGYGMMDQPSFHYWLGLSFLDSGMPRQALQEFSRAHFLAPDIIAPQLAMAALYNRFGDADQARQIIAHVRGQSAGNSPINAELSVLEADSWFLQTNTANAAGALQSLLHTQPNNARTETVALQTYLSFGDYPDAFQLVNRWLARYPDDLGALLDLGMLYRHAGEFTNSIAIYNHTLLITNAPFIHLIRDRAYLEAGQWDAAENDYLLMDKTVTNHLAIDYGLSEVAMGRHDTNRAIQWLERCLSQAPAGSAQSQAIASRIHALKTPDARP